MTKCCRLLSCLVAGSLALTVRAQSGTMTTGLYNDESSFRPTLSGPDLKVVMRVLGLGQAERQAVEDLYQGYAAALRNEGGSVRDYVNGEIEKAQVMQNVGLLEPARKRVHEWDLRSEQLKKVFLEDLKSLLSKEEEARWPIVERELRRMKHIGGGRLAGESLDLVRLTEDLLGGPPTGDLADLLNRYSTELDYALVNRERFLDDKRKGFQEAIKADLESAKKMWDEAQRVRGTVRDVNEKFSRQIADQLLPGVKEKFRKRVFEGSFPALVKPTFAEGYLKDVGELDTLTSDQRAQLAVIKDKYDRDREAVLNRGAAGWKQFEADDKPRELSRALGERPEDPRNQYYTGAWLPESHPLVKYRQERLVMDQALRSSLDGILTSEQKDAVPGRVTHFARFENWEPWGL
jgi:hypothetical protein